MKTQVSTAADARRDGTTGMQQQGAGRSESLFTKMFLIWLPHLTMETAAFSFFSCFRSSNSETTFDQQACLLDSNQLILFFYANVLLHSMYHSTFEKAKKQAELQKEHSEATWGSTRNISDRPWTCNEQVFIPVHRQFMLEHVRTERSCVVQVVDD